MVKVKPGRKKSTLIDYFIYIAVLMTISYVIKAYSPPTWFLEVRYYFNDNAYFKIGTFVPIIMYSAVLFKDLVFRNASIGKRIMGFVITDVAYNKPRILTIIKRAFVLSFVGVYVYIFRLYRKYGSFDDWELHFLKTRVVKKCDLDILRRQYKMENGIQDELISGEYDNQ